jgi:hypothetical protein
MPGQHSIRFIPDCLLFRIRPSNFHAGVAGALTAGEYGCNTFKFLAPEGELRDSSYTLAASLAPDALKQGLSGSTVYLNRDEIGKWEHGKRLGRDQILGREFEACIVVPRYTAGGDGLTLPIHFRLWQTDDDPYRQLDAVRPLTLLVNIETAGVLARYGRLFSLTFLVLLILMLWWLARRIGMPEDFRVALADGPSWPRSSISPAIAAA